MGIPGLWDVIGKGEIVTIAKLASDHYEKYGRPFRVAVDEAGWRFNNISPEQLEIIRQNEPAANTIEKNIMWRILDLMKLNIQLIFVFDGSRRPWKRNRRGGNQINYERIKLLRQLLDHLKIPQHQAPGEAEAECAAMQRLGVVDAVWSDDSDTLMFGATCVIRAHKTGTSWSKDKIYIHRAEKLLADYDMDHESLVLFAMLAGGDYNTAGLPGCGPKIAGRISRKAHGVAHALCQASKHDIPAWRFMLEGVMATEGKRLQVPANFPDENARNHSRQPTVSTPEQLHNLRGLKHGWSRHVDQAKLRVLLRERFNIWTKGYMKHLAPIFMIQELAASPSQHKPAIVSKYDIQLKKSRKKQADSDEAVEIETKVTFYPLPAIEIDITTTPPGEDWSIWEKNGSHYDPVARVEATILRCLLKEGLPEGPLHIPERPSQPRSQNGNARSPAIDLETRSVPREKTSLTDPTQPSGFETLPAESAPRKRGRPKKQATTAQVDGAAVQVEPKKRGRPKKDANVASTTPPSKKPKTGAEPDNVPEIPQPAVFRLPRSFSFTDLPTCSSTVTAPPSSASIVATNSTEKSSPADRPVTAVDELHLSDDLECRSTIPSSTQRAVGDAPESTPVNAAVRASTASSPPRKSSFRLPAEIEVVDLT